jgi:uncharacterized damage-inducible protein DinB
MLAGLTAEQIDEEVRILAGPGRALSIARWKVLHHVLFHGMQHHAEIAHILSEKGQVVGDIDFFFYMQ